MPKKELKRKPTCPECGRVIPRWGKDAIDATVICGRHFNWKKIAKDTQRELKECKEHLNAIWALAQSFLPLCPAKSHKMWKIAIKKGRAIAAKGKAHCQEQTLLTAAAIAEFKKVGENYLTVMELQKMAKEANPENVPFCRAHGLGKDEYKNITLSELIKMIEYPTNRVSIAPLCDHEKTHIDGGVRYCDRCHESLEVTSYRDS